MAEETQIFVVGGIAFTDMEQAKLAQIELKRIEGLNQKLDYSNIAAVAMVYEKSRESHIFKTPIGLSYMMRLQNVLVQHNYEGIEEKPIILSDMNLNAAAGQKQQSGQNPHWEEIWKSRLDAQKEKEKQLRSRLRMSVVGNVALLLLVLVLFIISQTGKNPTILNYKTKLLNQYTSWEKELEEREQAIQEREEALSISQP